MKIKDIIRILEEQSPLKYAEDWDNVGLLVGDREKTVKKIMISLDATDAVISQAVNEKVDMLITHHPLLFSPIKKITVDDFIGNRIIKLIQNNISYYAMHTNFDIMGMADAAASKLGFMNTHVLEVTYTEKLYKVVVYVPTSHADLVREAMTSKGGGHIGSYSDCTFNIEGIGTYTPLEGTSPYIGTINQQTKTQEVRIETIITKEKLNSMINHMIEVHPYEEVAYDIYELKNEGKSEGIGRYGYLPKEMSLKECANLVKDKFCTNYVRMIGDQEKIVKKVALSTGSGKSMIKYAIKEKVDVLITGDIDHHTALDALERDLCIIDAGHFGTERFMVEYVKDYLEGFLLNTPDSKESIEIILSVEEDPFQII